MQQHSKPVKPERLGLIGREHFARIFAVDGADPDQVKYSRELGHDGDLPFLVEAAFARIKDLSSTPLVSGINWSPAIGDPFRWSAGAWSHHSLRGLVRDRHILAGTPALIGVSLATPTVSFVDRGKSAAMLTRAVGKAVETAVTKVTKEWFEAWEAEQRRRRQHVRAVERHIEELEERRARQRATAAAPPLSAPGNCTPRSRRRRSRTAWRSRADRSFHPARPVSPRHDRRPSRRPVVRGSNRAAAADKKIHLRGLFYRIVSAGDIRRPDGSLFINDLDCWKWLQDTAAKAARWLGYVPFERIIDNRNDPPLVISYAETPQPAASACQSAGRRGSSAARMTCCRVWPARGRSHGSRTASS